MIISELVKALEQIKEAEGDLEISISVDFREKDNTPNKEMAKRGVATAEPIFIELEPSEAYDMESPKVVQIRNWPY